MLRVLAIRGRERVGIEKKSVSACCKFQSISTAASERVGEAGEDVKGAAAQSFAGKLSRHAYPLTEMVKMHGSSSGIN